MKKIIVTSFVILIIAAVSFYFYAYKEHRDISSETADFSISTNTLQQEFNTNDSLFNAKYADRTVEIYGKISTVDLINSTIIIDNKFEVVFKDVVVKNLKIQDNIKTKVRYVGYDDLLEEFKFDQAVIVD